MELKNVAFPVSSEHLYVAEPQKDASEVIMVLSV